MRALLLLFFIVASQALTAVRAGPQLRIVVGNERYDGLVGLIGVPPQTGDFGAMTIASLGGRDSRYLVFNLQLVNEGDTEWNPNATLARAVAYDWYSDSVSVRGFWRFSFMDQASNVLASAIAPAAFTVWDFMPFRTNGPPAKFGWDRPGLSPGWSAVIGDSVPAYAYLDITDTPAQGTFLFRVEAAWLKNLGPPTSVTLRLKIDHTDIDQVTVLGSPPH